MSDAYNTEYAGNFYYRCSSAKMLQSHTCYTFLMHGNCNGSAGIVTTLQAQQQSNHSVIPGRDKKFLSSSK